MPMKEVDLATQTLFAELLQRSLDAEFDVEYRENGTFVRKRSRIATTGTSSGARGTRSATSTVGPVNDRSITDRVERFSSLKAGFKRRQTSVRALEAAGLPTADRLSGRIVEAFWKAGSFRLRAVLIGTSGTQERQRGLMLKKPEHPSSGSAPRADRAASAAC